MEDYISQENEQRSEKRQEKKKKKRRVIPIIIFSFWGLLAIGLIFVYSFFKMVSANSFNLFGEIPSLELLENPKSELSSEVFYSDGKKLGKYFKTNRTSVAYEDISPNVINALIATEDVRFYEHSGVDLQGLIAIPYYLLKGEKRGSSTISQQLAKNLFKMRVDPKYEGSMYEDSLPKIIAIKSKEWVTSTRLERAYTKKEILTMYLNTVDFGHMAFGIHTAARRFFNKKPIELTVPEAATLIGLLKAPTSYSPVLHPEASKTRRNTVIIQMEKYGIISSEEAEKYKASDIELDYTLENYNTGTAQYFRAVIKDTLENWCRAHGYDLYTDGLKIYTTIDSNMQAHAEEAVAQHMAYLQKEFFKVWKGKNPWVRLNKNNYYEEVEGWLEAKVKQSERYKKLKKKYGDNTTAIDEVMKKPIDMKVFAWLKNEDGNWMADRKDTILSPYDSIRYYKHFLHVGMMSVDPYNGHVKAYVGGINYKQFPYDHVMQGKRQPGSTFKPIVYATAINNGAHPCKKYKDVNVSFEINPERGEVWVPKNADGKVTGETMTLRQAMARSINTITATLMMEYGNSMPLAVKEMAQKLGITSKLFAGPALCLGTDDVYLYDMVGAYNTFVNKGVHVKPFFIERIEDKYGNVLAEFKPQKREAISEPLAYTMLYMLKGGVQEEGGTGLGLYRYDGVLGPNNDVGSKTGTTQDYSDGWFMGVTPELVTGVWVGNEERFIHFPNFNLGQGARMALPIWGLYMQSLYKDENLDIEHKLFDPPSQGIPNFNCNEVGSDSTTVNIIDVDMEEGDDIMDDLIN